MKKRWRPGDAGGATKRTLLIQDDLWSWALRQPEGAAGAIRDLLERARAGQAARPVLNVKTEAGYMQAVAVENGIVVLFEDTAVLYYQYEPGQPCPVLKIPSTAAQTVSVPLKSGQVLSIPTPVETLEQQQAQARARQELRKVPNTAVNGAEGSEEPEEAEEQ